MLRDSKYFEEVDQYLNDELSGSELAEFQIQLEHDLDLANELALHQEVEEALSEKDIFNLRKNLSQIIHQSDESSFSFGLAEELCSCQDLNYQMDMENILKFKHSLPKIHLYQHKISAKETIHQFYKEQLVDSETSEEEFFSPYEKEIFNEVQNALDEHDIWDLRANLKQIARTMPAHQYSVEEIDNYIENQLDEDIISQFEQELSVNPVLAQDIDLIKETNKAVAEQDIMNLRNSLKEIQRSGFDSKVRVEEIDGYLNHELTEDEMAVFEAELSANQNLATELDLVRDINQAINEKEVMQLRDNLQLIGSKIASENMTERSFSTKFKAKKVVFSTVAASLVLLLGITGLLNRQAPEVLYNDFYNTYQTTGIVRSANVTTNQKLTSALQKFDNQEYEDALKLFQEVISNDQSNIVGHFYAGVSFQETGKYKNAIKEYETVVVDKDNLFYEQAEWYIGLCYLQTNEDKKAYRQFKKISGSEGFYKQKAQAILRKMKNTVE